MKKNFNAGDTWCWLVNLNTDDENFVLSACNKKYLYKAL